MLALNIVHFARVLRGTGMSIGPDRVLSALKAVEAVGIARRDDVHAALSCVMLDRHEQQATFDAAFNTFWRDPKLFEQLMHALLPKVSGRGSMVPPARSNRLAEALSPPTALPPQGPPTTATMEEVSFDAALTFSERERLQRADFESMTVDEFLAASRLAQRLPPPVLPIKRRRHRPAQHGTPDFRATWLATVRQPLTLQPKYKAARRALPPMVILLDISGSMDRYARMLLHYVHGLTRLPQRLHVFTMGTRLSNITSCLKNRDPDVALSKASTQVQDWRGGTRLGECLHAFNHQWARRVLSGNAAVVLITDGLDRDAQGELGAAAAQLRRLAHQVIWLNPLLRFDGFEPKAGGVRALLPHVDRMVPMHNLDSLANLAQALRQPHKPRRLTAH
jgi:uncharacterized protein